MPPGALGAKLAATPPWFTTPLRIPNMPEISAVRLGRQGTSDAYTLAKRTPLAAIASMLGVVLR